MKIATLFGSSTTEMAAVMALSAERIEVARFKSIGALISGLRATPFHAAVLEDSLDELPNWLAMLQLHCTTPLPKIVVGSGGAAGVSRALYNGADDYAVLDDRADDLVARVRAHVQLQHRADEETQLRVEGFALDAETQVLRHDGEEVRLTSREFSLAWALFANRGKVVSVNALSAHVWGRASDICKRSIEQHVYKLRRKLGAAPVEGARRVRIHAVYGVGYRLELQG
jgi:DNA-binding response OmpR family regulator